MSIELEKDVRTRVTQTFLRCPEGDVGLHHLCRSPVPQETPHDVREPQPLCRRLDALGQKGSCQIGPGFISLPVLMRFGNRQSSSPAFIRNLRASRRATSASARRIGRFARWYLGVWSLP